MKIRSLIVVFVFMFFGSPVFAQPVIIDSLANNEVVIEEFKLLNLCHCMEYIETENFKGKSRFLKENENQLFARYLSSRMFIQYYDSLYKRSMFFKKGVSSYFEKVFDYRRLDSLYRPIVEHYRKKTIKTEGRILLGFGDHNSFFDCYHRVNEIPLREELKKFLLTNREVLFR